MSTVVFFDGFDHYTNIVTKWNTQYGLGDTLDQVTPPEISSAAARNGAGGLLLTDGGLVYKSLPDLGAMAVGVAFRFTVAPPSSGRKMISLRDEGSENVYLYLNSGRTITVVGGAGASIGSTSTVFSLNTWYYLEIAVAFHATAGSYILGVNGYVDTSASGVNTSRNSNNRANILRLGSAASGNYPFHYDDLYVTTGDLLGACAVDTSTLSGTYPINSPSATTGQLALAAASDIAAGGAVHAVAVHSYASKAYGNTRAIRNLVQPGGAGTVYSGQAHYLAVGTIYYSDIFNANPNTAGTWTPSSFNTANFGVERYR